METYSGREALLKGSPYGEAAVVEVVDELRVDGATELSHLPVSRSDEDALDRLHENVVEQGVLRPRGQPVPKKKRASSVRRPLHVTFEGLLWLTSSCYTSPRSLCLSGSSSGCPGRRGLGASSWVSESI